MLSELSNCRICPRDCGINRYLQCGFCGANQYIKINIAQLHYGEEPCLSGSRGSGTIFLSHCNLKCVFCQNYMISVEGYGREISEEDIVQTMLNLQQKGAHNINLVTPTHYTIQLISALQKAKAEGLTIPIVWNSSAYEKPETLRLLKGLVDIYLPDFKYFHGVHAKKYSHAPDYPHYAFESLKEMFYQQGRLELDERGIAMKGVLLRLLVLPEGLSGTENALRKIAYELSTEISLSIMGQYYPAGEAGRYPELNRGIRQAEYKKVLDTALDLGFTSIYAQELSCSDFWTPRFVRR